MYGVRIEGYCLMTNHVHLVATPKREDSLGKAMGRTNLLYAQYINRKRLVGGKPFLWKKKGFPPHPLPKETKYSFFLGRGLGAPFFFRKKKGAPSKTLVPERLPSIECMGVAAAFGRIDSSPVRWAQKGDRPVCARASLRLRQSPFWARLRAPPCSTPCVSRTSPSGLTGKPFCCTMRPRLRPRTFALRQAAAARWRATPC